MARFLGSSLRGFLEDCAAHEREVLDSITWNHHHHPSARRPSAARAVGCPAIGYFRTPRRASASSVRRSFTARFPLLPRGCAQRSFGILRVIPAIPGSHCIVREGRPCAGPKLPGQFQVWRAAASKTRRKSARPARRGFRSSTRPEPAAGASGCSRHSRTQLAMGESIRGETVDQPSITALANMFAATSTQIQSKDNFRSSSAASMACTTMSARNI